MPSLRYIDYDLLSAANDWIEQSEEDNVAAEKLFWTRADEYTKNVDMLRPRLSKPAWEFFRHGYGPTGFHDATLIAMKVGDGLHFGDRNRRRAAAQIEFLNFEEDRHYLFDFRGAYGVWTEIVVNNSVEGIGDLYSYEIIDVDDRLLQLGFLFASGSSIIFQFHKLVFKRKTTRRTNPVSDTKEKI